MPGELQRTARVFIWLLIHCDYGLVKKVCGLQPTGLWFLRPFKGLSGEKIVPGMICGHGGVANPELLPVAGNILRLVPFLADQMVSKHCLCSLLLWGTVLGTRRLGWGLRGDRN